MPRYLLKTLVARMGCRDRLTNQGTRQGLTYLHNVISNRSGVEVKKIVSHAEQNQSEGSLRALISSVGSCIDRLVWKTSLSNIPVFIVIITNL